MLMAWSCGLLFVLNVLATAVLWMVRDVERLR